MSLNNPETAKVLQYIQETYGTAPEFLWTKTPNNAVFRHQSNAKWFAALLLDLPKEKLGVPDRGETVDILDLKCDSKLIGSLLDGRHYFPGYHMNKEHWITVLLDGSAPMDEVFGLIDLSYTVTQAKKQ